MSIDKNFVGAIPQIYATYLVPMLFESYAADLTARVGRRDRVLELAAGTGVVTQRLASALPATTAIVATDLNQAMLDQAIALGTSRPVEWRQADAMQLPFDAASFDAIVCQFGVMFFPDKAKAFAEAKRVLRPGGLFIFNVWDRVDQNEIADVVTNSLVPVFPADPPRFLPRTPYGYFDHAAITRDLIAGGFTAKPSIDIVAHRCRAASAHDAAVAFCQGTPLRAEIEARDASRLDEATNVAAEALAARFGRGPIDTKMQAVVVAVAN